jgi:hypothetical protein
MEAQTLRDGSVEVTEGVGAEEEAHVASFSTP